MNVISLICILITIYRVQANYTGVIETSIDSDVNNAKTKVTVAVDDIIRDLVRYANEYKPRMNKLLEKPTSESVFSIRSIITRVLIRIQTRADKYSAPCFEISRSTLISLQAQGAAAVEICAKNSLAEVDTALSKIISMIKVARQIVTDLEMIEATCRRRTTEETEKCILWRIQETDASRDSLEFGAKSVKEAAEKAIEDALIWNEHCNIYQVNDVQRRTNEVKIISDGCMNLSDKLRNNNDK